ncbi:hypothetical protein MLD38_020278 [Melastoma candidum]|uniref:Uncharacterized protein n=1 Tax=Melastoma candidum TaxID=119954 RepID=A0ACB9QKF8_9MYRT|nr:hypothetical protein MLD38_020278 [Melastoma candidum]
MSRTPFLLLLLLLLPTVATPSPLHSYNTLLSLAHSLTTRVSNHRLSRGDTLGAARARTLADHIEAASLGRWGFWTNAWRLGWDYARNYAWRSSDWGTYSEIYGAVGELNDLVSLIGEYGRARGDGERAEWLRMNYGRVVGSAKGVFGRLLGAFGRSGPLREAVETMRKEVVEGDFLRDCLEIGGGDLKGIMEVAKDVLLRFYSPSDPSQEL